MNISIIRTAMCVHIIAIIDIVGRDKFGRAMIPFCNGNIEWSNVPARGRHAMIRKIIRCKYPSDRVSSWTPVSSLGDILWLSIWYYACIYQVGATLFYYCQDSTNLLLCIHSGGTVYYINQVYGPNRHWSMSKWNL